MQPDPICPIHATALSAQGALWHCDQCAQDYRLQGRCDVCGSELENLVACGSSSWFCPQCKVLKSRSVVRYSFVPVSPLP